MSRLLPARTALGDPYAWAVSVIASVFAAGNIALGTILLAAPHRLSGASFAYILTVAPAQVWGCGFVASGLVALYGQYAHRQWPARIPHAVSALACFYWVGAFAYGSWVSSTAGMTGIAAYGIIAVTHAVVAVVSPHRPPT